MSADESALALQFFGTFRATRSGQALPTPRARKVALLLTLLTLRAGQPAERGYLTGTLWPDSDDRAGAASLRRALSDLRSWLGPDADRLTSPTGRTVALHLSGAFVDILAFDRAAGQWEKQGQIAAAEASVALYRGPLLDGFDDPFLTGERTRRAEQCQEMLEAIGRRALAEGDASRATRLARRAERMAPLSQSAQRLLYEGLARGGDRAGVLRAYRDFRILLRREMGEQPDAATIALIERLRREPEALSSADVAQESSRLPGFLTPFIGRERECAAIVAYLSEPGVRLMTLTGIGGIGKTRLAVAAARQVGGAFFADLSAFTRDATEDALFEAILRSLGDDPLPPNRTARTELGARLSERSALLVLDNCEQAVPVVSRAIAAILKDAPFCRILATSRMSLGIAGEALWPVPPVTPEEALALFAQRARAARHDFDLTATNHEAVRTLCSQVECIPLALELAAARVRVLPLEKISERLTTSLDILGGANSHTEERQRTMRATLDWSFELLTETERCLLGRISVFVGGWSLEAAEWVCAGDGLEARNILDLLTALLDKSLVIYEEVKGEARYRLLETVRQYAEEKRDADGAALRQRHRDYFLVLAEEAKPRLGGPEQARWLDLLEVERNNFREAMTFCQERQGEAERGLRLAGALQRFWEMRGYLREGRERLMALLNLPEAQPATEARASALNGAGNLAFNQADYPAARSLYEECLAIRRELGDKPGSARVYSNLGNVAFYLGDYTLARSHYAESLAIQRDLGDKEGMSINLNNLGALTHGEGDFAAARPLYVESLTLKRELGDRVSVAATLNNLGVLAEQEGDYAAAHGYLEESVALLRELGDRRGLAVSLNTRGDVADAQGDYAFARALHTESLTLRRELGDKGGVCYSLEAFASLRAQAGQPEQAALLWGAADGERVRIGFPLRENERERYDRQVGAARQSLGDAAFAAAWERGRALTPEQAISMALA